VTRNPIFEKKKFTIAAINNIQEEAGALGYKTFNLSRNKKRGNLLMLLNGGKSDNKMIK